MSVKQQKPEKLEISLPVVNKRNKGKSMISFHRILRNL